MQLQQIDVTGCRIVGAVTKELGHTGPKHHGVILGRNPMDCEVYIAESMSYGYQISTFSNFQQRYSQNGTITVFPNGGKYENIAVAKRAISELNNGGNGTYDLLTNNCECFVNRAMHNKSISSQVINTAIGVLMIVVVVYVVKTSRG